MGMINSTDSFARATHASQFSKLAARADEAKISQPERHPGASVQDESGKQHALVSYLKMPAVPEKTGSPSLVSLIAKPEQLKKELTAQGARTKLLAHHVAIKQDMLKTLRQEPAGALSLAFTLPASSARQARTSEGPIDITSFNNENLTRLGGAATGMEAYKSAYAGDLTSSWDLCDSVADAIGEMREDYLEVFQDAVEKYASFFDEYTKLLAEFGKYIEADDDKTIVSAKKLYELFDKLANKYAPGNSASTLYSGSKAECEAWAKQMGLDPDKCVGQKNGQYYVHIDTSPLNSLLSIFGRYRLVVEGNVIWLFEQFKQNSAQFAAMQSGMDMQKDAIQNAMQTITQKYSNANSTFENLIKILSSTITSLLDTDKSFLNV